MQGPSWRKFARQYLLPQLPGWTLCGSYLVCGRPDWILHGLYVDTSAFSAAVLLPNLLNIPLYVGDQEGPSGEYGERLQAPSSTGHSWTWKAGKEEELFSRLLDAIQAQAPRVFRESDTPFDLVTWVERRGRSHDNPGSLEAEAYSWIIAGQPQKATVIMRRLIRVMHKYDGPSRSFEFDLLERIALVRRALSSSTEAATTIFRAWRDANLRRLKMEQFIEIA
jgi:hypothetical protein